MHSAFDVKRYRQHDARSARQFGDWTDTSSSRTPRRDGASLSLSSHAELATVALELVSPGLALTVASSIFLGEAAIFFFP